MIDRPKCASALGILSFSIVLLCLAGPTTAETWAAKLGYPADKKILILHADDLGMAWEANVAAEQYFRDRHIQSGSVMMPAPWAADLADWRQANPDLDLGIHLTLNSEWQTYRWSSVAKQNRVSSLLDRRRFLLEGPQNTFLLGKARQVRRELHAQVQRAIQLGLAPTHIDTHIGTVYTRLDFFRCYLEVSRAFNLPAMTMADVPATVECLIPEDFPLKNFVVGKLDRLISRELEDYPFPSVDVLCSVPKGDCPDNTCDLDQLKIEIREKFFELVRGLKPGITQIFFHPSVDTPGFRRITNSWPQRVVESRLFADPAVQQFFIDEGILFTTWSEMMTRFQKRRPRG